MDLGGLLVEMLAMIDSGSNTSLQSKNAAERLGVVGTGTNLTMNLAGEGKRCETSEIYRDHCCLNYRREYQKDPGSVHYQETL